MILADGRRISPRTQALIALLIIMAPACAPRDAAAPEQVEFNGSIMGTTYHIKVVAALSDSESAATANAIETALKTVDNKMSTYKPDSEISTFNTAPAGAPVPLSDDTIRVLQMAEQVNQESDGAFDITVGPLVNAWGFGPAGRGEAPDARRIAELQALVGPDKIRLDPVARTVTKAVDGVYCDPASVAEGFAVDQASEVLLSRGCTNFMVEIGGEVRTSGHNASGEPWRIAVEKPVDDGRVIQEVVGLSNMSLSTSGNYRKFYILDGKRISHTIDPKTGRPVDHALASASVIHPNCALADAYSTAIMVLGPEKGMAFAEKLGLPVLLIIHGENGDLITRETESFTNYVLTK